jgi:hypothetical protein
MHDDFAGKGKDVDVEFDAMVLLVRLVARSYQIPLQKGVSNWLLSDARVSAAPTTLLAVQWAVGLSALAWAKDKGSSWGK